MIARLDPFDTFFFRDGKPFSLGDESWADGLFPPAPSVLYGALRTLFLARNGGFDKSKEELEKATKGLVIKGIYLEYNNRLHLPLPFDVIKKEDDEKEIQLLALKDPPNGAIYNKLTSHLLGTSAKKMIVETFEKGALIDSGVYSEYLAGKAPAAPVLSEKYLSSEPKIGIGRDNTRRSVSEGELFRVDMKRLLPDGLDRSTRLVVEFDFDKWQPTAPQIGKLGGEGKVVSCEFESNSKIEKPSFPILKPDTNGKILFKVCLTTPAIFNNGWFPGWLDKDHKGIFNGISVELLAAATDRLISVGGWDLNKGEPKTMFKAVPAGAVYCLAAETREPEKIKEAFHGISISDIGVHEGFGISLVGSL